MRKNINRTYRDKKVFERLYIDEKKGIIEISQIFNISQGLVVHWLRNHGIKSRPVGDYNSAVELFKDKNFLYKKYVLERKSLPTIAKEMNCGHDCVSNWLKRHGIKRRTISEALTGTKKPAYMIPIFRERARKQFKGEKNPNWKGGVSSRNHSFRTSVDYRIWQRAIWERDNYTCALCPSWSKPQAHHIKPLWHSWKLRLDMNNGITLCKSCHEKIRGKELDYVKKFSLMILEKRPNSVEPKSKDMAIPSQASLLKARACVETMGSPRKR